MCFLILTEPNGGNSKEKQKAEEDFKKIKVRYFMSHIIQKSQNSTNMLYDP